MNAFAGTAVLVRHALRQDRVKLPIWLAGLSGIAATSAASIIGLYPTEADRIGYATNSAVSVVARAFNGPTAGPHLGSILTIETFTFLSLLGALMSAQTVIRHTRREEETGRSELVGSSVVGRFAPLTTALLVAAASSAVLGALIAAVFVANGLPVAGSLGNGACVTAVCLCFAGIAAVSAQVMNTARAANGTAGAVIGVAFLLRAVGDALGTVAGSGTEVVSAWPSWLSPFGWGNQLRPFSQANWAVFGPIILLSTVTIAVAVVLNARRDLGSGMMQARLGPAEAPRGLRSPLGLAWRLQRGVFLGWGIGALICGATYGSVCNEINSFVGENDQMKKMMEALGGSENMVKAYIAMSMSMFALLAAGYAVQSLLRLRTEETGTLEPVLATSVSRHRWLASHVTCAATGSIALLILSGVSFGLTYGLIVHEPAQQTATALAAISVQVPAVLVIIAFIVAMFALLPGLTSTVGWTVLAACVTIMMLGAMLDLPQWVIDLSPFSHIPLVPVDPVTMTPLVSLSAVAIVLSAVGFAAFRRRDVKP